MRRPPRPYEWARMFCANVEAAGVLVGWLVRGAPGPWWRR